MATSVLTTSGMAPEREKLHWTLDANPRIRLPEWMIIMSDFLKFYDLESYLFGEVGPRFRANGVIEPTDFFMILIWKANRAKTKTHKKLSNRANGCFNSAVKDIAKRLYAEPDSKAKLRILMRDYDLFIPTASAILTVLYPEEFTVYDQRVCKQARIPYQPSRKFGDELWKEYQRLKAGVTNAAPANLCLRDKDRYLFGKSVREDAERDSQKAVAN